MAKEKQGPRRCGKGCMGVSVIRLNMIDGTTGIKAKCNNISSIHTEQRSRKSAKIEGNSKMMRYKIYFFFRIFMPSSVLSFRFHYSTVDPAKRMASSSKKLSSKDNVPLARVRRQVRRV